MRCKLTARSVQALKPGTAPFEVRDTEIKGFLLRVQPSGTMTYYLDYRTKGGTRKRYRIGTAGNLTPAQARDTAEKLAGNVANGVDLQATRKEARKAAMRAKQSTLGAFITSTYADIAQHEQSPRSDTVGRVRRNFAAFLDVPMAEFSPLAIQRWRSQRLKDGKAKATINRDLNTLRAVLSKAVTLGVIGRHPLPADQVKAFKTDQATSTPRYLAAAEEEALREALDQRERKIRAERASANTWRAERRLDLLPDLWQVPFADYLKPMVLLALNTGLRRGELFNLTWDRVDTRKAILTVAGKTAKSGKTRHVPLNAEALRILRDWRDQTVTTGLVFPSSDGAPFNNIATAWENLIKAAKITSFRFHDLRHTFASKLVMAGVPLNTVRELLGHSEINMTLRYSHLAEDHKAEAVNLLNAKSKASIAVRSRNAESPA